MYIPEIFKEENPDKIFDFIRKNNFGILVLHNTIKSFATHIPFEIIKKKQEIRLFAHIAKNNPQHALLQENINALIIFQGAHTYISSSWYDHENVPTWNYLAAHIYGKINITPPEKLLEYMQYQLQQYEPVKSKNGQLNTMNPEFLHAHLNGITGFEIRIEEMYMAKKLSQNRDKKNYDAIIHHLQNQNNDGANKIAHEMKKNSRYDY